MDLRPLAEKYRAIFEKLEDTGGEMTPEIFSTLKELGEEKEECIENVCKERANCLDDVAAATEEVERLNKMISTRKSKINALSFFLKEFLKNIGSKKERAGLYTVRIQTNSVPLINIVSPLNVPAEYAIGSLKVPWHDLPAALAERAEKTFDKSKIKIDAKTRDIPGVLVTYGDHVRIV